METTVSTGTIVIEEESRNYVFTERARHPDKLTDVLIRTAVKIHAPVHLKALALFRTGKGRNMLNQSLAQTLNLVPIPTTEIVKDPIGSYSMKMYGGMRIYGEHILNVTMTDNTGEARSFKLSFLAADIPEDMMLGSDWMFDAGISLNFGSKTFYWKGNYGAKATASSK
ncbi:MAG: hypothetical protein Q9195_002576 [Heterodermia aff. obscurata]